VLAVVDGRPAVSIVMQKSAKICLECGPQGIAGRRNVVRTLSRPLVGDTARNWGRKIGSGRKQQKTYRSSFNLVGRGLIDELQPFER